MSTADAVLFFSTGADQRLAFHVEQQRVYDRGFPSRPEGQGLLPEILMKWNFQARK